MSCVRHIYKNEGVFAFYRSYTTQLAMNVPFQSIHFIAYEFGQSMLNPDHSYNPKAHVVAGKKKKKTKIIHLQVYLNFFCFSKGKIKLNGIYCLNRCNGRCSCCSSNNTT